MTPDTYTNQELFIEVGDGHELYVHDWGSTDSAIPIVVLHGGPGSASRDRYKQQFDPTRHRVIFFDQRGCGRSLPYGSLEHNTTQELIKDITTIADKLRIKQFVLFGGSWGSCLALAYALEYPGRVHAMVLRGIFTGSQAEIDWLDEGQFRTFFPDTWQAYLARTPKTHQNKPSRYHFKRALTGAPQQQKESAYAYECLEAALLQYDDRFTPPPLETYDPSGARIEIHYLSNRCFMPNRHILKNAHKLTMPVYLVQGRYDMVCPPATAYELYHTLPRGELTMTLSGHKQEHEDWNVIRTILRELTK